MNWRSELAYTFRLFRMGDVCAPHIRHINKPIIGWSELARSTDPEKKDLAVKSPRVTVYTVHWQCSAHAITVDGITLQSISPGGIQIPKGLGKFGKKLTMDTLEHLEKELEALLWICFSSRYLFLIFKEKIFFQLFFVEHFLVAKIFLPIHSGIPL